MGDGLSAYALVGWVLAAIGCVLLPLPRWLVDLSLTASLGGAVLLLVASVMVRRSTDMPGFPRLVLLMTLTRLALNITTTRLILSEADAGRVVDAFATLVIQGDLLVGAVIFVILTLVQFVIIARGGERIAEVAARFALDGLPGHQAAIEADLRGGSISAAEAARRRARLLERSSFYGKMDGAARWVRGDAIVGLALTGINFVGGMIAGWRGGMGVGDAADVYGRLTIGDGLVAQVPALLVGLAAALLVARVDAEEPRGWARSWVTPGMLAAPAGLLAALSLVPGMPRGAFLVTAAGLAIAAVGLARGRGRDRRVIEVCLSGHVSRDIRALRGPLAELRRRCAGALGIAVPELVAVRGEAGPPRIEGPEGLAVRGSEVVVRFGGRVLGVPGDREERAGTEGQEAILLAAYRAVVGNAEVLIDLQEVEAALEDVRAREPAVVREALKVVGPAELLELARGLLRERVPLPPFSALLEAVASEPALRQAGERGRGLEGLRRRLAPHWLTDVIAARARLGPLAWVRPTPEAEAALLGRTVASESGLRLRLDAVTRRLWRARVLAAGGVDIGPPLLVCSSRARPAFALLMGRESPQVVVLSATELQEVEAAVPGEPGGPPAAWIEAPLPETGGAVKEVANDAVNTGAAGAWSEVCARDASRGRALPGARMTS